MAHADEDVVAAVQASGVLAAGGLAGALVAHVRKRNRVWGAAKGVFWTATTWLWVDMVLDE